MEFNSIEVRMTKDSRLDCVTLRRRGSFPKAVPEKVADGWIGMNDFGDRALFARGRNFAAGGYRLLPIELAVRDM